MIDTYKKIDIGMDIVEKIVHIADVHIRLTKRHDEYREAFEKVNNHLKTLPENTIVIVAGDVLHGKVDLSPESVELTSEFLKGLADIRPTILVAGNHDCLLTNKTRLDSLSPIVHYLHHDNLFYLKETGLYGAGNILFNNMSVFDDPTEYLDINKITKKINTQFDTKIALYHGGIHGVLTDIGYMIENRSITTEYFSGHDIAVLGDIHRAQTFYIEKNIPIYEIEEFSKTPEADRWEIIEDVHEMEFVRLRDKQSPIFRYPGSLIQQNHGEALTGHGFTIWNVANRKFEHVEIPNDYGYFTIEINDGKLITDISNMPSKPKLRVRCKESIASEVKKVITEIRQTKQITDLVYMRVDADLSTKQSATSNTANLNKISEVDYQNTLIESFLKEKYPDTMDDDTLKSVKDINKSINSDLSKDDQSKNIRWKPIKFEFSNMFSYGEDNIIDFTKLTEVYGLFAANASGKSSLMDAICFTVFDKSSRAFKAAHVINSQKMSFSGKFTFEINKTLYVIERKGTRDKKSNVKVDVDFHKIVNGEKICLNSEARRSTNEIIRDYLGSYEDFVLTSLALQGNQGSFIDMGQTERKELLSQFIGLNIFDHLSAEALDKTKELSGAIKAFNKEDNSKKISDTKELIVGLESKILDLTSRKEDSNIEKKVIEDNIRLENDKIVSLENVPTEISSLAREKKSLEEKISLGKPFLESLSTSIATSKEEYNQIVTKLLEFNKVELEDKYSEYEVLLNKKTKLEAEQKDLKSVVDSKIKKIQHLETHKYDPNCEYCCNNVFVKDAVSARESLSLDRTRASELKNEISKVKVSLDDTEPFIQSRNLFVSLEDKRDELHASFTQKELKKSNGVRELEKMERRLSDVNDLIKLYEKSKDAVETNIVVRKEIDRLTTQLNRLNSLQKSINLEYVDALSKKVSYTDKISLLKERIEKIEKSEEEFAAYQYYISAIGRDGIPYNIISDAVPKIEQEANNILSQIVEFSMSIETDGKNVNVYIKYDDKKWPLELCSGMEKFVAALALRVALINISNLPRAPFLVVDEGFGALDSDNMAMVHALFDYLKTNFEFIIVISHLDAMRDMVDKQLEIKKENGFSKIDNTK